MNITAAIRSVVRAAAPPTDGAFRPPEAVEAASAAQCAAILDAARDRLRAARIDVQRAAAELREADERLARARRVVEEADRADREADEAQALARSAARDWTAAGCPDDSRPDPGVFDSSAAATRAADAARTLAEGAAAALPGLTGEAERARSEAGQAQDRLRSAIVAVLAARVEPCFSELARLRDAYIEALRPVAQLRHLVRPWGPAHPLHGFSSGLGAAIDARLREVAIEPLSEPDIVGGAHDLRAAALQLLGDSGANV